MKKKLYLFSMLMMMLLALFQLNAQQWVVYDGSGSPDVVYEANGALTDITDANIDDPMIAGNKLYQFQVADGKQFNWRAPLDASIDSFTFVARVKAYLPAAYHVVNFNIRKVDFRTDVRIEDDKIKPSGGKVGDSYDLDMTKWHVIRGTFTDTVLKVYVDENAVPVLIDTITSTTGDKYFRWGDASGGDNYGGLVDWVIFDSTGVYAPGEGDAIPDSLSVNHAADVMLITDDLLEQELMDWLEMQGFNVTMFWPGNDYIDNAGPDTIDMINASDLVIIGRSGGSTNFQDSVEVDAWNAITAPVLNICPWKSRNSRLKLFNSGSAHQKNSDPPLMIRWAHVEAADQADPVFTGVTFTGDSMPWSWPANDFISVDSLEEISGDVLAVHTLDGSYPVMVRFTKDVPYYPTTWSTPASDVTYMGMGNDAAGPAHFFPLHKEARKVFLNEALRLTGQDPQTPVWTTSDVTIAFVTNPESDDSYREQQNMTFLDNHGFDVRTFWPLNGNIGEAPPDTLAWLNSVDLVIFGRSGPSSSFQDSIEYARWNAITAPAMLLCPWKARSSRLRYFHSTTAHHRDTGSDPAYATIEKPDDPIFDDVTLVGDSMAWCIPPHDWIWVDSLEEVNGEIVASFEDKYLLLVRFAKDSMPYATAATKFGGDRTYFGFGNDNLTLDGAKFSNFWPLTREAKKVYLAEICRMVGVDDVPEAKFTADDYRITFVAPYEGENDYVGDNDREIFHKRFLRKNGFRVEDFWPNGGNIGDAPQDTLDLLNAADLVIYGRSGPSSSFQDSIEYARWNAVTAPVMCVCPWKARSSRLKLFNSTTAHHIESPEELTAHVDLPDDPVFDNVTLATGDSLVWFAPDPHDAIWVDSLPGINGEVVATYDSNYALMVRFTKDVEYYDGSVTMPASDRTYMGFGHDGRTVGGRQLSHFFPFTDAAQQVYFNELCRMLGAETRTVVTVDNNASLDDITYDVGTLTPSFDDEVYEYTLELVDTSIVDLGAVLDDDEFGYLLNDDEYELLPEDYGQDEGMTVNLIAIAENGYHRAYSVLIWRGNVSTKEVEAVRGISVYPNPAYDVLNIVTETASGKVKIYDAVGKLVLDRTFSNNNNLQLNISNLRTGFYMIQVDDGQSIVVGKFLKQ